MQHRRLLYPSSPSPKFLGWKGHIFTGGDTCTAVVNSLPYTGGGHPGLGLQDSLLQTLHRFKIKSLYMKTIAICVPLSYFSNYTLLTSSQTH